MENSDICKFWKLDMLEESAQIVYKEKKGIIVDIPSPETRDSIPDWLVKVMRKENGYDPKLIIKRKELFQTDLNTTQSCLSMHLSQLKNTDFLTKDETIIIDEQFLKTKKEGLKVVLVDPKSHKHEVDLRKWKGNGNGVWKYVFNNGWNKVIATKIFEVNHVIEIWSFRDGSGKLCFALSSPTKSDESSSRPSSSRHK
ncbi:unnamed protein product [Arabidopsis halleri]